VLQDLCSGFNTVKLLHPTFNNGDVWLLLSRPFDGLDPRTTFGDAFEIRVALENMAQSPAKQDMIICE
jgi:hypothetical protein